MPKKAEAESLEGVIREILRSAKNDGAKPGVREAERHFRAASKLDYSSALRGQFSRQQLKEIFDEVRSVLPTINQQVFRIRDPRHLARVAADMGVVLQANPFEGSTGRALRGFYVDDGELLKRPLIGVNTAGHPVSVAAAFWHEIGHHLTNRLWGCHHEQLNLNFGMNYQEHLKDPREIGADMVMVLAAYPNAAARRLFGERDSDNVGPEQEQDHDRLVSKVIPHFRALTGFEFEARFSAKINLHYLAGIIHAAKLRRALLLGFDI